MIIASISDLDPLGMDFEPFFEMVKKVKEPDLLLLGGDIYEYRSPEIYGLVLDFLKMQKWTCPIVAVFGNREFDEDRDDIRKICKKRILFLDEEKTEVKIGGKTVGIVGTEGSLDIPTWWQFSHVKGINKIYDERREKVRKLLLSLKSDVRILLSHYCPTYKTVKGEDKRIYGLLGSERYEKVLLETRPTFAIHGHAHYGIPLAFVGAVPVFNVCFTINKRIVQIDPDKLPKAGLAKFTK
jgi:Icc-related predicted phosphoesterase